MDLELITQPTPGFSLWEQPGYRTLRQREYRRQRADHGYRKIELVLNRKTCEALEDFLACYQFATHPGSALRMWLEDDKPYLESDDST